jgi:thioredoxin 1
MCGDFYKWTDDSGETHFSDTPAGVPAKYRNKLKTDSFPAPPPKSTAPEVSERPDISAPSEPKVAGTKNMPLGGSVMSVTDADFAGKVNNGSGQTLVYFWATWCGVCRRTDPVFNAFAGEYGGKTKMLKMDIDASPKTPKALGVKAYPTFILFQGGKEVNRIEGGLSKAHFEKFIGATAQAR